MKWSPIYIFFRDDVEWDEEMEKTAKEKISKNSSQILDDEKQGIAFYGSFAYHLARILLKLNFVAWIFLILNQKQKY